MVFLKINWCKVKVQAQSANEIIQRNAFVIKKKKEKKKANVLWRYYKAIYSIVCLSI
jgi:hypothetical protein